MSREVPWVLLIRSSEFYGCGIYFERALQKVANVIPICVETAGPWGWIFKRSPSRFVERLAEKLFKMVTVHPPDPDLILVIDPVRKKFDFSKFHAPTAFYAIDSHVAFQEHVEYAHVQDYDYVFVAQKDDIWKYREIGCEKVYWLPLACDPEIHRPWREPIIYDVCFVGKILPGSEREKIVREIKKRFCTFLGNVYLHDMSKVLSQSKIVLNKSILGDLNMRVFETLSCGRFLLTDKIRNGLEELFMNQKHLVLYESLSDLVEKIEYYLKADREREKIAMRGHREVLKRHTYLHRVGQILQTVGIRTNVLN
jgi:spore maturation protein CgeB